MPRTVVLPLYGRLAQADQARVFSSAPQRRVVLATNVAETSLTIPGIVYVVDTGLARVNRHDPRSGVTRLLVEPISRASADQRKGRAGRTQRGVCFRLYEESDFAGRPAHTDPEILRVGSWPAAILQMKTLGLIEPGTDIEGFPFLDLAAAARGGRGLPRARGDRRPGRGRRAHRHGEEARPAAGRSAHRPDDPRRRAGGRAARGAGHRGGARRPGSAGAAARRAAAGRRRAPQVPRRGVRLRRAPQAVALLRGGAGQPHARAAPQALQGQLRQLHAHAGVGGRAPPALADRAREMGFVPRSRRRGTTGRTQGAPPRPAPAASAPGTPSSASTSARGRRASRSTPRRGSRGSRRRGSSPPSWWRPRSSSRGPWRASIRPGSRPRGGALVPAQLTAIPHWAEHGRRR